jgi:hypothetical protein
MSGEQQPRPRFGQVRRADGTTQALVFYPTDRENEFIALSASDERELVLGDGDTVNFDTLDSGQSVIFRRGDAQWTKGETGRVAGPKKKETVMEEQNKSSNGWWKGLVALAGIALIVVLTVAGINWAMSL